jgi:hypothetical protein
MGMIRFTVGGTAKLTGMATKGAASGIGKLISKKYPETGKFVAETGHAIVDSSVAAIDNMCLSLRMAASRLAMVRL